MRSTGIPQVSALLTALALTLPACVHESDTEGATPESVGLAGAELEQPGPDGPRGKRPGKGRLEGMKKYFAEIDENGDEQITRQEMETSVAARFAKADTDGDGMLATEELEAMRQARWGNKAGKRGRFGKGKGQGRMARKIDSNGDGNVSQEEFSSHGMRRFEMADADDNDTITRQELEAAAKTRKGRRGGRGKGGPKRGGMSRILEADANDDGQITRAEANAYRGAKFDKLDQNGDGVLTADERPSKSGRRGRGPGSKGGRGKGFEMMDDNGDGQVTKDEFLAKTDRIFERLDGNDDDVISAEELEARPMKRRQGRRGSARVGR